MVKKAISEAKIDCGVKKLTIFCPKVVNRTKMNGATVFSKTLYQNNRFLGNGGPSKVRFTSV